MNLFRSKRGKERPRFYLLPGQGGAAYRRKQRFILTCSVVAALLVSVLIGVLMYWLGRPGL